ncbi:hypothetical protein SARC_11298 [Sphaeroforma arctica JP610]|uniref:Uncharacterized protein n=1 Tax=Sphaeroforma arctica JP610 TaxID=667725 RepID=A0A0L0FHG6_9EUKA|nr:hypothetical protein SARC_11298 [Sphaeroforma arctica JP610]KNC76190.1 hypothetical protein SARC_11298 [Sphaeroforma arctica JP610]|eukprot:XP_014150092.1 hypothetical protein SARC_11298 [Sphaeroforma arctica JP610]
MRRGSGVGVLHRPLTRSRIRPHLPWNEPPAFSWMDLVARVRALTRRIRLVYRNPIRWVAADHWITSELAKDGNTPSAPPAGLVTGPPTQSASQKPSPLTKQILPNWSPVLTLQLFWTPFKRCPSVLAQMSPTCKQCFPVLPRTRRPTQPTCPQTMEPPSPTTSGCSISHFRPSGD